MNRTSIRTFVANLAYYSAPSESLSALNCRGCRNPLDIHQPNPNQPDQFLGTCQECNRWYRVESDPENDRVTIMQLPEVREANPKEPAADRHL